MALEDFFAMTLNVTLWGSLIALTVFYRRKIFIAALIIRHVWRAVKKAFRDERREKKEECIEIIREYRRRSRKYKIAKLNAKIDRLSSKKTGLYNREIDDMLAERRFKKKRSGTAATVPNRSRRAPKHALCRLL